MLAHGIGRNVARKAAGSDRVMFAVLTSRWQCRDSTKRVWGLDETVSPRGSVGHGRDARRIRRVTVHSRAVRDRVLHGTIRVTSRSLNIRHASKTNWLFAVAHGKAVVGTASVATLTSEMISTGGIATAYRALLEVSLQDVTSAESIFTEMAHVRSVTGVWKRSARG